MAAAFRDIGPCQANQVETSGSGIAPLRDTLLALLCLRGVAECKARLKARGIEDNNQLLYYGFYACCAVLIGLNIYMWVYHPPFTLSFG